MYLLQHETMIDYLQFGYTFIIQIKRNYGNTNYYNKTNQMH